MPQLRAIGYYRMDMGGKATGGGAESETVSIRYTRLANLQNLSYEDWKKLFS